MERCPSRYKIYFEYKDGHRADMELSVPEIRNLCDCLRDGDLFVTDDGRMGFWTDRDDIRYITMYRVTQPSDEE